MRDMMCEELFISSITVPCNHIDCIRSRCQNNENNVKDLLATQNLLYFLSAADTTNFPSSHIQYALVLLSNIRGTLTLIFPLLRFHIIIAAVTICSRLEM